MEYLTPKYKDEQCAHGISAYCHLSPEKYK